MNRDSGAENPGQRTVADLLKEYGGSDDSGSSQRGDRRRRRRAEDTTETAPHAIIDRVLSDSGQLRAIRPDEEPPPELRGRSGAGQAGHQQADPQQAQPQQAQAQPQQVPQTGPPDAAAPPGAAPPPSPTSQPAAQPPGEPVQQPSQQALVQQPSAQQIAVQQQQAQQQTQQPPQGAADDFSNAPVGPEGANFWAQRFAAAGSPPAQAPPEDRPPPENQPPAGGDVEPTVQQQPVSPRPQPYPRSQPAGADATEKLPMMSAQERAGGSGTAMFAASGASGQAAGQDAAAGFGGAYDFDEDVDGYGGVDDYEDFDDYGDEPYGPDEDADLDRPAGLPADGVDDGARSPGREWVGQVAQAVVGLLGGAVVFFGFSWLWTKNSVAAFVAALVVTGCLVLLARRLRGDDLQTTLLAVLAGLFCTVSPAALLMLGQ